MVDVQAYFRAGTVHHALQDIDATTGEQQKNAQKELDSLRTTKKLPEGEKTAQPAEKGTNPKEAATVGTVQVATTPDGADVYADGEFVGNAPATLKLSAGKHTVKVTLVGYKDWSREISVSAGSAQELAATLERQN